MEMIKAALFDMDGLLLDTERLAHDAFYLTLDAHDAALEKSDYAQLIGLNRRDGTVKFQALLPDLDHVAFLSHWDARYNAACDRGIPLRPGVVSALDAIDLPKAVVTSSKRASAIDKLTRAGLLSHFQFVVGGDDVTKGKPDPEPYLTGATKLGFNAHACAAFEDSVTGTRAALAAGCITVQIPDLITPSDEVRSWGHRIEGDLVSGARAIGLIQ